MTAIAVDRRGLSLLQTQKWRKMQHDKHKNDLTVLRLILAPLLLFNSSHEQNARNAVIAMVPGHGWSRKSLHWYRKRSPFLVKLTWEKTNRKGAGRYLPTGNHSGCDAVHIPKRRCVLRQAFQQLGLHAAQGGNRAAGLSKGSHGLCFYRYEMRGFHADHRSDGLSGQQPHHRPLLRFQYHEAVAVLLDVWPFPQKNG